jgi:hypothetical protein
LTGIKTPEEFIASASTLQAAVFAASCDLLGSAAGRRLAAACDAYSGELLSALRVFVTQ